MDKRKRCPVCVCVMHGDKHYGSYDAHVLIRDLKAENDELLRSLAVLKKALNARREAGKP